MTNLNLTKECDYMKRLIALVLALVCVLGLVGCSQQGQQNITNPTQNNEESLSIGNQTESEQNSEHENDEMYTPSIKSVLKLEYRDALGFELDTEEPKVSSIHLEYSDVPESQGQNYVSSDALKVFADYVSQSLSVDLNNKWTVFVHYYDEDKTVGMVEFIYTIGQINTNKSIVFNLNNGIADTVYYKHLQEEVNEEDILHRVSLFNSKYEQEKKVLEEDEKLVKETTNFTYYYNDDRCVYSYAVFFSYGEHQLVNNDYGTVCMIDENGNAVD